MRDKEIKICPVCKSDNTKLVERRKDNGILGPGYTSWVVDFYYSCQNCGVRFDDLKK
jgi:C4-type Zn-finger protein